MPLQDFSVFLNDKGIQDPNKLENYFEKLKSRIYLVGRFNSKSYSDEELKRFEPRKITEFQQFCKDLGPAVGEKTMCKEPIDVITLTGPADTDASNFLVINPENYFFNRGIENADPEVKKLFTDSASNVDMIVSKEKASRGETVYIQLRRHLKIISTFIPRIHEIVALSLKCWSQCNPENGLPNYDYKSEPSKHYSSVEFINFLFASPEEDKSREFTKYAQIRFDNSEQENCFNRFWRIFKNQILTTQHQNSENANLEYMISEEFKKDESEKLIEDFRKAANSIKIIKQMIKSKMLLYMILEWVLDSFFNDCIIGDVTRSRPDENYNHSELERVSDAILTPGFAHDYSIYRQRQTPPSKPVNEITSIDTRRYKCLKKPLKRPSAESRGSFLEWLSNDFQLVMDFLVKDNALEEISRGDFKEYISELKNDTDAMEILKKMSGFAEGEEAYKSFLTAMRTIFSDVILPALFKDPVLTKRDLQKTIRGSILSCYQIAYFLDDENAKDFDNIGNTLSSSVDENITESGEFNEDRSCGLIGDTLKEVFILLTSDKQKKFVENLNNLREAVTLFEDDLIRESKIGDIFPYLHNTTRDFIWRDFNFMDFIKKRFKKLLDFQKKKETRESHTQTQQAEQKTKEKVKDKKKATLEATKEETKEETMAAGQGATQHTPSNGQNQNADENSTEFDRNAQKIIDSMQEDAEFQSDSSSEKEEEKNRAIDKLMDSIKDVKYSKLEESLASLLDALDEALGLIYTTYCSDMSNSKPMFRNQVERMTLANFFMVHRNSIGLAENHSNLYNLLLDLVLYLDPENPKPFEQFVCNAEVTLTSYFQNQHLSTSNLSEIIKTIRQVIETGMKSITGFVSELWGVKYLLDCCKSPNKEIYLLNLSYNEFIKWLIIANLGDGSEGWLRSGKELSITPGAPSVFCMCNSAFTSEGEKGEFVNKLSSNDFILFSGERDRLILPPMIIAHDNNFDNPNQLPVPLWVIKNAPSLNIDDYFGTNLPPYYLFLARLLGHEEKLFKSDHRDTTKSGRLISLSDEEPGTVIKQSIFDNPQPFFDADYFLYSILKLWAVLVNTSNIQGNNGQINLLNTIKSYFSLKNDGLKNAGYLGNKNFGQSMFIGDAQFSFDETIDMLVNSLKRGDCSVTVDEYSWVINALRAANLPQNI